MEEFQTKCKKFQVLSMEFCLLSQHVDRRSLFGTLYLPAATDTTAITHVLVKRNGVGRFPDNRFCESEACTFYRGRIGWLIMWFGFLAETGAFGAVQIPETSESCLLTSIYPVNRWTHKGVPYIWASTLLFLSSESNIYITRPIMPFLASLSLLYGPLTA
uniref:Uncharacterized protein n=1 Tax=Cucumis melo TaxID=3656 RepID=A0A9I9EIE8_CUCME